MPLDPISATIIGSIVGNVVNDIAALPPPTSPVPIEGIPRMFPENTLKGALQVFSPTMASINGETVVLAPGVQIRDPFNMVVLPGQIGGIVPIRYQADMMGAISKIWILSQREAAQP